MQPSQVILQLSQRAKILTFTAAMFAVIGCQTPQSKGPPPMLPSGRDTPIGVGGGAITFYVRDGDWTPPIGTPTSTYCAVVKDASQVEVQDFDTQDKETIFTGQTKWDLQLVAPKHVIAMHADIDLCGKGTGPGVQIKVAGTPATPGAPGFYSTELHAKRHNRRFRDVSGTDCQTDEDSCERLVKITYNGQSHTCDNLDCKVLIGKP